MLGILADSFMVAAGFDGLPQDARPRRRSPADQPSACQRRSPVTYGSMNEDRPPASVQSTGKNA